MPELMLFKAELNMTNEKERASAATAGWRGSQTLVTMAAFLSLFGIVGFAYYGLPFFYDFMTNDYGWSRATVTSGNALGKLIISRHNKLLCMKICAALTVQCGTYL